MLVNLQPKMATVTICGRIVVLKKGAIAEDGTYEQLLAERGRFRCMVESDDLRG
jgi:ABC-type multidrug transport system fused ATPase/permease subunit